MHNLSLFAGLAFDPGIRGILVVVVGVVVLCGSIYMLLATNVGARLGMLLALAGVTGWLVCLTLFWWISPPAIGPRGNNPEWKPVEVYVTGGNEPQTAVLQDLPRPKEFPTPDEILAANPELDADFPNGFILSDLQASHSAVVDEALADLDLGGWRLVSTAAAGEVQAAVDATLTGERIFTSATEYKKLNVFEIGGKPTRLDYCPNAVGGTFMPDDVVCRIKYKFKKLFTFRHPAHYAVVQVQQVIPQETKPGEPPPLPKVDPTKPVISVVMERDLGNVRFIPFLYFVVSAALFAFFVLVLHYRDKTLDKNLQAAKAANTKGS